MKNEILPFTNEMISDAANLLSQRHKRHRTNFPLLPARFEESQAAVRAIDALWQEKLKSGYAALCNGEMTAYLIGETTTDPWGRAGYVYLPGCAMADGENPGIIQDLYAVLGEDWVRMGCFNHYLYLSALESDVLAAMFDLGFGKERVDALLDIRSLNIPKVAEPSGVIIRKAGPGDNEHLGSLSNTIFRALAKPPNWHPTLPEDWNDLREGWSELADDKEWTIWLALENDQALGMIGFRPEQEQDTQMLVSPRTIYLSVAATQPEARGRGINTYLTWLGLERAQKAGYEICYSNWISPNLLASRFCPRFGFQDAAYRLAKKVNPMIAWAKDE